MRPVVFALLCCVIGCHDSNARVDPATVQWMEWPAEVNAGQPFRTRLVVWSVCAIDPQFRDGVSADLSAVTFAPYYLVSGGPIYCTAGATSVFAAIALDTAGRAPGLHANTARTYEMRAAEQTFARVAWGANAPVGTYGTVTVRPSGADGSRHNAGGYANLSTDTMGCVRLRPGALYNPAAALVLEDQSDTTSLGDAFVRGYIYDAPTPVCGETRVFHLVSRN